MQEPNDENIALKVIKKAGGIEAVSDDFELSYEAVRKWTVSGQIPSKRVARVSELTGGFYQPHQIRPDVFPAPQFQNTEQSA